VNWICATGYPRRALRFNFSWISRHAAGSLPIAHTVKCCEGAALAGRTLPSDPTPGAPDATRSKPSAIVAEGAPMMPRSMSVGSPPALPVP
jgi:hypothetical protein